MMNRSIRSSPILRSWQANPPVTTPPQFTVPTLSMSATEIYAKICSQCHGQNGEGTPVGPTLNDLSDDTDQEISAVISTGITDTNMLAFRLNPIGSTDQ